jgi:hypothetical protein
VYRTVNADLPPRTAIKVTKSNWDNLNAINAKPVQLDKFSVLSLIAAQSKDQSAIAINNTIQLPDNARTAQQVNCQEMVEMSRTVSAELQLRTAMQVDKYNLVKHNAINAKHANKDMSSAQSLIAAHNQESPAIVTNNSIQPLTHVQTVHQVNCQEMVKEVHSKVSAELPLKTVMLKIKSSWDKLNAMPVKPVHLIKFSVLSLIAAQSKDQLATVTNNTDNQTIHVKTAQLVNCQTMV